MTSSRRRASVVARVEATEAPIADHVHLTLRIPAGAPDALPGQFMHLRPANGALAPLLRRPMSISAARVDGDHALWSAFFAQVGPGTDALAALPVGGAVDVLGPIGRPYDPPPPGGLAVLIGGGRGIAPMMFFAAWLAARGHDATLLGGARRADLLWVPASPGIDVRTATEDGSAGQRGSVLDLLDSFTARDWARAHFYACGPHGLLARVAALAAARHRPAQVTMEARMGCAMNVCRGCVLPTRDPSQGYKTVCTDGPVFDGDALDWDALAAMEDAGYGVPHGRRAASARVDGAGAMR